MNIIEILGGINDGAQADIIGDRCALELVSSLAYRRGIDIQLGGLISELAGGLDEILRTKSKRNALFMALNKEQRDKVSDCIGESNIFDFRYTTERKRLLYSLFSIKPENEVLEKDSPENSKVVGVSPGYGLFEHQSRALIKCAEFLESSEPRVMLHMPTGSGKTRTSMHLIARHLNKNENTIIVWLVSGKELCEQAANEFQKSWSYLGERVIPVIKLWSDKAGVHKDYTEMMSVRSNALTESDFATDSWPLELKDGVIIASLDSMRSMMNEWEPSARHKRRSAVSLIIFDEAHRSVAVTYKAVIETLMSPTLLGTKLLGLSATPGRRHFGEGSEADEGLVALFGNQRVQLEVEGYSSPIEYLVNEGYLAKLEKEQLVIANQDFSKKQLEEINLLISSSMDVPNDILKVLGYSSTRNLQIVECVERLVKDEDHKRVLVFSPSVNSAIVLSNICKCIGIKSSFVHASSGGRDKFINEYKSDDPEPQVIFNYGVLATGFDAPKTSAVVIARPTTSLVLLNQMAGRAIRGPKVKGNKVAKLITVVDIEIPVLVEPNKQFHAFDDSWSLKNA